MNQYVCVCVCACWQREPKVSGQRSDQNTSQDYLQDKDHMVFWPTSHTKQTQTLHWLHLSPIILCFLTSRIADAWAVSEVRTRIHTHTKWFSTLHNRKMRVGTMLRIILSNRVRISGKRHRCSVFPNVCFFGTRSLRHWYLQNLPTCTETVLRRCVEAAVHRDLLVSPAALHHL